MNDRNGDASKVLQEESRTAHKEELSMAHNARTVIKDTKRVNVVIKKGANS